ncbi:multidrug resistance protein, MATE family [Amphibacillus marinus]|uniref:Probable multidrug resistance protein NorM n=1 Tax=Amphibacillus marinus TaxID=872970 RepID=A0A1H8PIQ4_9BACI|nr:MATE family efflux transporter [Amphibacillus marinus]SEO41651.1 multidrug resistance protein, MATE family [Amphibacillus marinus]
MYHAATLKDKLKLFLKLLWPILITQVSLAMMSFVDTIMSGRVGTSDLAGVAIGASLWSPVFTGVNGVMLAVTPLIAHALGKREKDRIQGIINQAIYLAIIIGVLVILIGGLLLNPVLNWMQPEESVHFVAKHYLIGLSIGIIPLFISNVLRNFYDGQGMTRISMFITISAVPFNFLLNYLFIFGNFGFPQLGGIGAGYATGATYWVILLINILLIFKLDAIKQFKLFVQWNKPSLTAWQEQLSIGVPIGLTIFFESSIFSVVTLLISVMFSTTAVAANQIVISFSSMVFMMPLSIAMALTIVVGYSVGGDRLAAAKQYSILGVSSGIGILGIAATFMFFFREQIASWYSTDASVVELAGQLFLIAILYQLSDGAQSGLQGVLRGYKDVKIPFFISLISYWLLGIPIGYLLATFTAVGPFGLWIGILIGLTSAAVGFLFRLRFISRVKTKQLQT